MKFTIQKNILLKGIQNVQGAINIKTNLPILSNILLEALDDRITLTATDLDIGLISTIPIKPHITGSITIPAKKFSEIIKEAPDADITISLKKNNSVHIEAQQCLFKIVGIPKDEFPQLPELKDKESVVLPQKRLKEMLALTSFAMSRDESRYVLNGVLFTMKPAFMRLVATDGRRLAVAEHKMQLPKTMERKFIVGTKAINELGRILTEEGEVRISLGTNQTSFDVGPTRVIARLIEGEYPNYEQVVPKEIKDKLKSARGDLLASLRRVALFTNPDSMAIKLDLGRGKVVLSKSSPYIGEAREELAVDYNGREFSVGFNPEYLIDVLKNINQESVSIELADPEKPGTIRIGDEYTYVVLPMQLG